MAAEGKRSSLGRGLSALLGEAEEDDGTPDRPRPFRAVPIETIRPGPYQPRRAISEDDVRDLAQSIGEKGILQPILVRRAPEDPSFYEIIAGERRWRAAQLARLHELPVIVKELSNSEVLEVALVENLQRRDLTPMEEGESYRRLMDEFAHTQQDLAKTLGRSRSHVANTIRLLALPDEVKRMLDGGDLSAGHARAILGADDPLALAQRVVKRGLNVRQTERLARGPLTKPPSPPPSRRKNSDTIALERDLSNLLGLRVEILFGAGGGSLTLHYKSLEQLDDVLHRLSRGAQGSELEAIEGDPEVEDPDSAAF